MNVCWLAGVLAECLSADPARLCYDCSYAELGETPQNLAARTARGQTKNVFYKRLADDQARVDEKRARTAKGRSRFE